MIPKHERLPLVKLVKNCARFSPRSAASSQRFGLKVLGSGKRSEFMAMRYDDELMGVCIQVGISIW